MLEGSCHCGAVHWRFRGTPESATSCNCTVCRRYGVLWVYDYENERITTTGETRSYVRGRTTEFHFCANCGCVTWWRAIEPQADGRRRMAVNARLAEPEAVVGLILDRFDGLDTFDDLPRDGRKVADIWF